MLLGMVTLNRDLLTNSLFLDRVGIELKRAERYRIFISLIVLDIGFVETIFPETASSIIQDITRLVQKNVRAIDNIALIRPYKLGLLLPETTRQGAEIASKRVAELIRSRLSEVNERRVEQVIPLEMASYPDAAGAKSVTDFLKEYTEKSQN